MMSTSFKKKTRSIQIEGTRPSIQNKQLLVSTGVPSLDQAIGGGLAVGTVLLIEEDTYGSYSKMLLKYFLAEGVVSSHSIFISSASIDISAESLIKELPGPILSDPGKKPTDITGMQKSAEVEGEMKIAWRYEHLPQFQSSAVTSAFGHYYDLTKSMDENMLKNADITYFEATVYQRISPDKTFENEMNPAYVDLLKTIQGKIDSGGFSTTKSASERNILRIGIHSFGSPLWGESFHHGTRYDASIPRFLLALRGLMRSAFAVCVVTIPTHLFQDNVFTSRLQQLSDTVIHLESFTGSEKEKNPAFKEYHGLFHVKKLPRLNSLQCFVQESADMAFKLHRKKLTIEKLHLPPELSETVSRDQEDPVKRQINKLDF